MSITDTSFASRPVVSATNDPAMFDESALAELVSEVGLEAFMDFASRMAEAAEAHQTKLVRAWNAGDDEAVRRAAHALCGLLGHFGMARASHLARGVEAGRVEAASLDALADALHASLMELPQRARKLVA